MPQSLELLSVYNIRAITDELQDVRQLPNQLRWVNRIPAVDAEDSEISARYTGRVYMADLIADDAAAPVRSANPIRLVQDKIPNLKIGEKISQSQLALLARIGRGSFDERDVRVFANYVANRIQDLRLGVEQRRESLLVAMLIDALDYDRLGLKIAGGSWGMPADLKVTPAVYWDTPATATPMRDLQTISNVGDNKYGLSFNRITMSTEAFDAMVATTEFQNKSVLYNGMTIPAGAFPAADRSLMASLAGRILNKEIEIDDRVFFTEGVDGSEASARVQPNNKVLLTSTAADGNASLMDWADGLVIETMLQGMVAGIMGEFEGPESGLVSYVTAADANANPPGVNMWSVRRGFPRKHKESASAVLTVKATAF